MMPTWKQQDKTAASQLALLTPSNLSPVAVTDGILIRSYDDVYNKLQQK